MTYQSIDVDWYDWSIVLNDYNVYSYMMNVLVMFLAVAAAVEEEEEAEDFVAMGAKE